MAYEKIAGIKCYLSPVREEDAGLWANWLNDLEVAIPLGDEAYRVISTEGLREWIRNIGEHTHAFNIVQRDTDRLIGRCLLFALNHVNRSAMAGIFIGEKDCWGQGYGEEALRLLLDYGFTILNLNSVMLGVFSFNTRAIACYKKIGFKEIGRRRQARII